jgi:predicted  nucleic acid-binding Zn-ribbon protein
VPACAVSSWLDLEDRVKADPYDQEQLLVLQSVDAALDRTAHRARTLPERARAAELERDLSQLRDQQVMAETRATDLARAVRKAESDVASVRARAERDRQLLASGTITVAKHLSDMEHEVESLARRQAELEDAELEIMEELEQAESDKERARAAVRATSAELASTVAARDAALQALRQEHAELTGERAGVASGIPADLLAVYDRLRSGGADVAVARVRHGSCEACRLQLSYADTASISAAAPDEVVRCPECSAILVRAGRPASGDAEDDS